MNILKLIGMCVMTMVVVTKAKDKVYLGDVKSLTFQRGAMTVGGGRTPPIQQMNCVGGTGAGYSHVHPSTIQCENRGSDGNDIQWECKGELLEGFRFGSTMVACEGYSTATDPYIMTGLLDRTRPACVFATCPMKSGSNLFSFACHAVLFARTRVHPLIRAA